MSNSPRSKEIFVIDIFTSLLADVPSEIDINLNNLNTSLPCSSDTIHGVSGVSHSCMFQAIVFVLTASLAPGL